MLGGYESGRVPRVDIQGSRAFLLNPSIKRRLKSFTRAADTGAGIGRVTKDLLSHLFATTDLVEPVFHEEARSGEFLAEQRAAGRIGEVFGVGLQDWYPQEHSYNLIWNQWCLGHLEDDDLVEYFKRCKLAVVPDDGVICVKENVCVQTFDLDNTDSSVTRSDQLFKTIFKRAGLKLVYEAVQHGMPKELYPVKMYALI